MTDILWGILGVAFLIFDLWYARLLHRAGASRRLVALAVVCGFWLYVLGVIISLIEWIRNVLALRRQ